jgi:hypothetical protein
LGLLVVLELLVDTDSLSEVKLLSSALDCVEDDADNVSCSFSKGVLTTRSLAHVIASSVGLVSVRSIDDFRKRFISRVLDTPGAASANAAPSVYSNSCFMVADTYSLFELSVTKISAGTPLRSAFFWAAAYWWMTHRSFELRLSHVLDCWKSMKPKGAGLLVVGGCVGLC